MAERDDRAARLAAKLRENLRKRKAQARGEQANRAAPRRNLPRDEGHRG